eukprot:1827012-Rhodomonas_salina.2
MSGTDVAHGAIRRASGASRARHSNTHDFVITSRIATLPRRDHTLVSVGGDINKPNQRGTRVDLLSLYV